MTVFVIKSRHTVWNDSAYMVSGVFDVESLYDDRELRHSSVVLDLHEKYGTITFFYDDGRKYMMRIFRLLLTKEMFSR